MDGQIQTANHSVYWINEQPFVSESCCNHMDTLFFPVQSQMSEDSTVLLLCSGWTNASFPSLSRKPDCSMTSDGPLLLQYCRRFSWHYCTVCTKMPNGSAFSGCTASRVRSQSPRYSKLPYRIQTTVMSKQRARLPHVYYRDFAIGSVHAAKLAPSIERSVRWRSPSSVSLLSKRSASLATVQYTRYRGSVRCIAGGLYPLHA